MYYIYKITNLQNNKIYIGITSTKNSKKYYFTDKKHPINKRFQQHLKAKSLIGNSLRKYGVDSFKLEQLSRYNTDDKNFIKMIESRMIKNNNSFTPNGYNNSFSINYLEVYNLHEVNTKSLANLCNININKYGKFSFDIYRKEIDCELINYNNKWINKNQFSNKELREKGLIDYKNNVKYIKQYTIESYNLLHIINCYNKIINKNNLLDNKMIDYKDIQYRLNNDLYINYYLTNSKLYL